MKKSMEGSPVGSPVIGVLVFVMLFIGLWLLSENDGSALPQTKADVLSRCLDVPIDKTLRIELGLRDDIGGGKLRAESAQAVKSNDFKSIYFIAADIEAPGLEDSDVIGVWSSNSLDPHQGLIFSVNGMAGNFSVWPKGRKMKAQISMYDDGAKEAVACVKAKLK